MNEPKNILVPTDFSDLSAPALDYASLLGRAFDARILLVHVVEHPVFLPTSGMTPAALPAVDDEIDDWVIKNLGQLQDRAPNDVDVATRRVDGEPAEEIVDLAKEENTDLILMSTHGRTGLSRMLLGSTAEKVLRKAPCPVLYVKHGASEFGLP